jgi:hypothetical protein
MLGYEMADLDIMMDAIEDAIASGRLADHIQDGLTTTLTFLQGLLAEGYFDGYED